MKNAISWFEIPSADIDRAAKFYESIFGINLIPLEDMMNQVGGAIVFSKDFHRPSLTDGPLIYLNGNPDVQHVLDKVESAGGKILVPKTQISPEYGYMAVIQDTENNRIGLHNVPKS